MNKEIGNWIFPLVIMGASLMLNNCKKEVTKKDPVITWANPAEITEGTLLSDTQLNATADVPGTFVYTPAIGSKLDIGANQDLKVDFTPSDVSNYKTATKTVKITVIAPIVSGPNVTDIDGNLYHSITIGTQTWMVENLKTTKYNDGTTIPNVIDPTAWKTLTTPAYCWYYNDTVFNKVIFGALYNWYAVNTGKLAPTGWHVPTDAEWTQLTDYLGGDSLAGDKLKEAGTAHWHGPNTEATNETGFTALPGGTFNELGYFTFVGEFCFWWSATKDDTYSNYAWERHLYFYHDSGVYRANVDKKYGYSVRCVKD